MELNFESLNDTHLMHLFNKLDAHQKYRTRVRQILENGPMRPTPINRELAVLGLVKLNDNYLYEIRNPIYDIALRNFFLDY